MPLVSDRRVSMIDIGRWHDSIRKILADDVACLRRLEFYLLAHLALDLVLDSLFLRLDRCGLAGSKDSSYRNAVCFGVKFEYSCCLAREMAALPKSSRGPSVCVA